MALVIKAHETVFGPGPGFDRPIPAGAVLVCAADDPPADDDDDVNVWAWLDDESLMIQQGYDLVMFGANEFEQVATRIMGMIMASRAQEDPRD